MLGLSSEITKQVFMPITDFKTKLRNKVAVFTFKIIFRAKLRNNVRVFMLNIIFRTKFRNTVTVFT